MTVITSTLPQFQDAWVASTSLLWEFLPEIVDKLLNLAPYLASCIAPESLFSGNPSTAQRPVTEKILTSILHDTVKYNDAIECKF